MLKIWGLVFLTFITIGATKAIVPDEEIIYGRVNNLDLYADIYKPATTSTPGPAVIYIHGGGLLYGSRKGDGCTGRMNDTLIEDLVEQGFLVMAIDYRLATTPKPLEACPNHDPYKVGAKWPAPLQDAKAAIRFLKANATKYKINENRIAAWGFSGGGTLSLMSGFTPENFVPKTGDLTAAAKAKSSSVKAVINWFGVTDWLAYHSQLKKFFRQGEIEPIFGGSPDQVGEAKYNFASAVNYTYADAPPVFNIHGTCDIAVPVEQASAIHESIISHYGNSTLVKVINGNHGLAANCIGIPSPDIYESSKTKSIQWLKTKI